MPETHFIVSVFVAAIFASSSAFTVTIFTSSFLISAFKAKISTSSSLISLFVASSASLDY